MYGHSPIPTNHYKPTSACNPHHFTSLPHPPYSPQPAYTSSDPSYSSSSYPSSPSPPPKTHPLFSPPTHPDKTHNPPPDNSALYYTTHKSSYSHAQHHVWALLAHHDTDHRGRLYCSKKTETSVGISCSVCMRRSWARECRL